MNRFLFFVFAFGLFSCKNQNSTPQTFHASSSLKYAKGFRIEDHDTYKDIFVKASADSAGEIIHYRLIRQGAKEPLPTSGNIISIRVPIATIVCTSTTHIPLLDYLGDSEKLVGFPNTTYISSPIMRKRIDQGLVQELGIDGNLNIESLLQLQPSLVMSYTMSHDLGSLKKIQALGVPVVINSEFLEQHPLGRAEWIKFMALFLGKERKADSLFNWIEHEYVTLQKEAAQLEIQPTVLTGIPYGGIWYLPGGQNYGARFFKDAGCQYMWDDDPSNGFLKLSLETVFTKSLKADYWIGTGSFETYDDLKSLDNRFAQFSAFQNKKVYNYNKRIGATGGNEYLELGYLRPDLILKDLIQITHPERYENQNLYFYQALK